MVRISPVLLVAAVVFVSDVITFKESIDHQKSFLLNTKWETDSSLSPLRLQKKRDHDGHRLEQGRNKNPDDVRWGSDCSALKIMAVTGDDVQIRCEFWAPVGSTIIWKKEGEVVRNISYTNNYVNLSWPRNSLRYIENQFHIWTSLNLYCNYNPALEIEILIKPPENSLTYRRKFKIVNDDTNYSYSQCCGMCDTYKKYSPRIIGFAKTVIGIEGEGTILPCWSEGSHELSVTWKKNNKLVVNNFEGSSKGDLIIDKLTKEDSGMYSCVIYSYFIGVEDIITTYLHVTN